MRPKILLVDDREENLLALGQLLKRQEAELLTARSGREALELLLAHEVALALLDVHLPEMDGFELAELMRGTERTRDIPIIFVTADGYDRSRLFHGYDVGAVDFLVKPLEPRVLDNKVHTFLRLYRQREELRQAVRLRDEFISVASHELRTPLTALGLQLESLRKHITQGGDAARALRKVETAVRQTVRLESLIEGLLSVSRIASGRMLLQLEPFDLRDCAAEVADRLAEVAARAGCEVRIASDGPTDGRWDRSRIDQVIMNLLTNAIKYGPGHPIEVALSGTADGVSLEVRDQGIGIAAADAERIFGRFERAVSASEYGGLGLGLYVSREIVRAHGGDIEVRSAPGQGAAFLVRLPRRPRAAGAPEDPGGEGRS